MNASVARWNPLRELEDFQHRILSAFHPGPNRRPNGDSEESLTAAEWMPPVDISEDEKEYLISVELPEVAKDAVNVTMENGLLSIRGERSFTRDDSTKYHRMERSYGNFARSFSIPSDADHSSIQANFKDGMLYIKIAKNEAAKPRQIEVRIGS